MSDTTTSVNPKHLPVEFVYLHDPGTWEPGENSMTTTRTVYFHRNSFRILYSPDAATIYITKKVGEGVGTKTLSIPVNNVWSYCIETKPTKPPEFPEPPGQGGPTHAGQLTTLAQMGKRAAE
jgi:hypothetical protein